MAKKIDKKENRKATILMIVAFILTCVFVNTNGCEGSCLPDKEKGDIVTVTQKTYGAVDRNTYNKLLDAIEAGDNATIAEMVTVGQVRFVMAKTVGILVDKDVTRACLQLPDDGKWWWIYAGNLK